MGLVMGSGSIINTSVASAFLAEVLACLQAMSFVKDMGFLKMVVEGDSRTIIMKATRGDVDRSVIGVLTEEIKLMAFSFNFILFQSINRISNSIAHAIARKGFEMGTKSFEVEEVPEGVVEMVDSECRALQEGED